MKRFILKSILFLIPIAGILLAMEVYMRSLPNSYSQKNEWMKSHASEVEILVLGNSHGLFGIRPDLLGKKAYNLCQVSQTFEYDEYLLRHFEPQLKSLTDVLLIADNSNLFDLPLEKSEWFRCTYYRLYLDCPKFPLLSKYGFELSNLDAARNKWQQGGGRCDSLGWNESYTKSSRTSDYLSDEAVKEAVYRHQCKDWNAARENQETLLRIVAWCKARHVRLTLLQSPVSKGYYQQIDRRQLDFIKKICKNYNILSIDDSQNRHFTDDDFYDPDHLNTDGASKWSKLLKDSIFQ